MSNVMTEYMEDTNIAARMKEISLFDAWIEARRRIDHAPPDIETYVKQTSKDRQPEFRKLLKNTLALQALSGKIVAAFAVASKSLEPDAMVEPIIVEAKK